MERASVTASWSRVCSPFCYGDSHTLMEVVFQSLINLVRGKSDKGEKKATTSSRGLQETFDCAEGTRDEIIIGGSDSTRGKGMKIMNKFRGIEW